jgi:hypothetical protein
MAYSNRMADNAGGTIGQTFIWVEAMGSKKIGSNGGRQSAAAIKTGCGTNQITQNYAKN